MNVLVDTSCWIQSFRDMNSIEAVSIASLLNKRLVVTSSLIVAELLQGARGSRELSLVKNEFKVIPIVQGLDVAGGVIGELGFRLRRKGHSAPIVDLALATLAIENHLLIYTMDKHFHLISKVAPIKFFEPARH